MVKAKIEKLKDSDGEVMGYFLNGYYLLKKCVWMNQYAWCVTDDMDALWFGCDVEKFADTHFFRWVNSYKEGRELLKTMAECNG